MKGIIIKNISNDYTVKSNNVKYVCKARGKFRNENISPFVGDIVEFNENDNLITKICQRKNILRRPPVSNVDIALIITSVYPTFDTVLLDKLLTIISFNNIEPVICFTKLDLITSQELININNIIDYYKDIGYLVICNDDLSLIKDIIKDKVVVLTGQSGSGKSTLLNRLDKNLELKTNEISLSLGRGKHTTRHTELYEIEDGFIVDTPGFSSLDFNNMSKMDIRDNMKEMFDNLEYCKYRDCMHDKEDGCVVKEKVFNNEILKSRYDNYKMFIKG